MDKKDLKRYIRREIIAFLIHISIFIIIYNMFHIEIFLLYTVGFLIARFFMFMPSIEGDLRESKNIMDKNRYTGDYNSFDVSMLVRHLAIDEYSSLRKGITIIIRCGGITSLIYLLHYIFGSRKNHIERIPSKNILMKARTCGCVILMIDYRYDIRYECPKCGSPINGYNHIFDFTEDEINNPCIITSLEYISNYHNENRRNDKK